jgi:hypothetical protein
MYLPASQFRQKTWPESFWWVPGRQLVHLGAVSSLENFPEGQGLQRESSTLVLSFSNVPGVHCRTMLQNGWLVSTWNLPDGQAVHTWALVVAEYVPDGQGRHRASSRLVLSASNWPGVHLTLVSQYG